jgi:TetR/AcrR family fatty acid metabolism transcriptional regulator
MDIHLGQKHMKDDLHDQLAAARRERILDAAARIFAAKGFHPATIRDVAREAGIADGTIYNYFENKTALLLGVFDRMRERVGGDPLAVDLSGLDFRGVLRLYFAAPLLALQGDNFALFRVIASEMMVNAELRDLFYARVFGPMLAGGEVLLRSLAAHHQISAEALPLTVRALSGMIFGVILERIMGDPTLEAEWERVPDALADLIINGIAKQTTKDNS